MNSKALSNIILDFDQLKAGASFISEIEAAYGKTGHGILFVKGIPGYVEARARLLPIAHRLANLPQNILKKYARPEIFHSRGWSCGVEQFHGKFDVSKGSFYSNCCVDTPAPLSQAEKKYYSEQELQIRAPNVWVDELPELEAATKAMSRLMISTGVLVAKQIDAYARAKNSNYAQHKLSNIIERGQCHVGRVLHYFPFDIKENFEDDWCGWHNDHGALTALTSAIYTDKEGKEVDFKETKGGLYAKNRFAETTKISIPKDMLAFQLGESAQILTGGILEATPHCVVRSDELAGKGIGRNTFALFMEPDDLEVMSVPQGTKPEEAINKDAYKIPPLQSRWDNGIHFKEFHKRTIQFYS